MKHVISDLKRTTKIALIDAGSKLIKWFPGWFFGGEEEQGKREPKHFGIFYLSAVGSLGDAAMGYSIVSQIRDAVPDAKITFLIHKSADRGFFDQFDVETVSIEGYFDVFPKRDAAREIAKLARSCTHFIIPGADVLDGVYSKGGSFRRLQAGVMAGLLGAQVHAVGFSFSERAPAEIRQTFRNNCQDFHIVCRDPQSATRLSEVMGREVPHASDLAFLLPIGSCARHPAAQIAEDWIRHWRGEGRPVVIFNANPLSFQNALPNMSRRKIAHQLAASLDIFAAHTNAALLFLTHDNRSAFSDAVFSDEILQRMTATSACHFVPETIQPTDIKRLCQLSDLVVTGRMHLGIAGLGSGRTTMITDYQGKVRGLYDLFDTPELALDLGEITQGTKLADLMLTALENTKTFERRIGQNLPRVRELSRKNLAALWTG